MSLFNFLPEKVMKSADGLFGAASSKKSSSLEIRPGGSTPISEFVESLIDAAHSSLSKKLFKVT